MNGQHCQQRRLQHAVILDVETFVKKCFNKNNTILLKGEYSQEVRTIQDVCTLMKSFWLLKLCTETCTQS